MGVYWPVLGAHQFFIKSFLKLSKNSKSHQTPQKFYQNPHKGTSKHKRRLYTTTKLKDEEKNLKSFLLSQNR